MILSEKEKKDLSKLSFKFFYAGAIGAFISFLLSLLISFLKKDLNLIILLMLVVAYCTWLAAAFFTLSKYPGCIPKNKRWLAPKWLENSVHTWVTGDPYHQHNQRQSVYGFACLCFFTGLGLTLFHGKYFLPCFLIGALGYVWIRSRPQK